MMSVISGHDMSKFNPVSREIYDCEVHDYRGSAHAHVMHLIAFGSYISQLDNNNTRVSGFLK